MSSPIAICRTSELGEAGSFWTQDVAGVPVLAVRDARGTIRAFVNRCRHRGVRLVYEQSGVTKSFTCLLHGWTYDAEGQMGGAVLSRLAQSNPMLSALRDNNALTLLPSSLRHGFVWVAPAPRDVLDVASFLGPADAALAALGVESLLVRARSTSEIATDLATAIRPRMVTGDALHILSHDVALVLRAHDVSVFTIARRAETDDGEPTAETRTLEHVLLARS